MKALVNTKTFAECIPLQKRYKVGDVVRINKDTCKDYTQEFIGGGQIKILEICRHDYLIQDDLGKVIVVYQNKLTNPLYLTKIEYTTLKT